MLGRERRARERDGEWQTRLMRENEVELPFDEQDAVGATNRVFCIMESIERARFFEERQFRASSHTSPAPAPSRDLRPGSSKNRPENAMMRPCASAIREHYTAAKTIVDSFLAIDFSDFAASPASTISSLLNPRLPDVCEQRANSAAHSQAATCVFRFVGDAATTQIVGDISARQQLRFIERGCRVALPHSSRASFSLFSSCSSALVKFRDESSTPAFLAKLFERSSKIDALYVFDERKNSPFCRSQSTCTYRARG